HVKTGNVAWQVPFVETLAARPMSDHERLILLTASGSVVAFRDRDGALLWRRELGWSPHAPATQTADRVYVPGSDGRLAALDGATGAPLWEHRFPGSVNEILASGDRVFAGSNDNFFYCLMARDGKVDWRWRTGGDVIGKPAADEDTVYFV